MNVGDLVTFTISDLLVFRKRSAEECMIDILTNGNHTLPDSNREVFLICDKDEFEICILTNDLQRFWCFTQFAKTVNCIGI